MHSSLYDVLLREYVEKYMPLLIEDLVALLDSRYTPADIKLVKKAYTYAEEAHRGQTRHTGEPYFSHCT
ncbi:MAG: hypothetical protein AAB448_03695, partial [Patescibacteria group bacterium]